MEQDYSASLANTMVLGMYAVTEYYFESCEDVDTHPYRCTACIYSAGLNTRRKHRYILPLYVIGILPMTVSFLVTTSSYLL